MNFLTFAVARILPQSTSDDDHLTARFIAQEGSSLRLIPEFAVRSIVCAVRRNPVAMCKTSPYSSSQRKIDATKENTMYRTSHSIRILSAAVAVVFGLGLVAAAGGALRIQRAPTGEPLQVIHLEPVVIKLHPNSQLSAACEQAPKAAL
jgi:hypothetical protein